MPINRQPSVSPSGRERSRRCAALIAAYLGTFLATLDISIVNVALPTLQQALRTDIAGLQWVVNAYAICLSAFMLSSGALADRYGHKRAWMAGVVLFTLGSALCAWSTSLELLLLGRAVQGCAGALLIPGAMPILSHAYPDPKERAQVIGGWSAFSALALILGPLLGGLLLHSAGWTSIFLINIPLGVLALGLGAWGIAERRYPAQAALDPAGQLLSVLWLAALTYGLIEGGEQGFTGTTALLALSMAGAAFMAFVLVEARVPRPLLALALFRDRAFAIVNFASFALGFSYYSSLFFFSIYLQNIQGATAVEAGWRMMPQFVITGCVSLLFGRLSARMPLRWLLVAGYGVTALSMSAMVVLTAHTPYWIVATLFGLLGLGAGLAVPATSMAVMSAAPPDRAGTASATMNALRQMGMTIGIALLGGIMSQQATRALARAAGALGISDPSEIAQQAITRGAASSGSPAIAALYVRAMEHGFHAAMACAGLACAVAMALLLGLAHRRA